MSVPKITPLLLAALAGDLPSVERALAAGEDVDTTESQHGNTTLMLAAYHNRTNVVSALIRAGATVDARDTEGNTALMKAAWAGATEAARQLIAAGADVDVVEINGMTPLMIAAFHGRLDIVRLLVDAGADTSRVDRDGYTALRNAEQQGHQVISQFLAPLTHVNSSVVPAEKSMNFDIEDVEPFFSRVSSRVESGFSAGDARRLAAEIARMQPDDEREWQFEIAFRGTRVRLSVRVFMDDVAAPDVAVAGPQLLIAAVEEELERFIK
jgi:uncharacterized protein